jgi:3-hydroxyisobutyrate dehydrogenase-like beta-hydroxyacid dehydrogenase
MPLAAKGAQIADDPASCVRGASRVHLVLTSDDAVDVVIESLRPALSPTVSVYDHSTNLPQRVKERVARLRKEGVRYVSAPVFMSPRNAREASGMILLSGDATECAEHQATLAEMTGKALYVGAREDLAAFHKISGNGLLIGLMGLVGDLVSMGRAQGLEPAEVLSLYEQWNPATSIAYFGRTVANAGSKPATFELQMARKDVGLMLESAQGQRLCALPAVAAAMDAAIGEGRARQDYAVFARGDR